MSDEFDALDTETAAESLRDLLERDGEAMHRYLMESFLMDAMLSLHQARKKARLTQAEVAKRLKTKQSVVARWEAAFSGAMSLRNYIEFALACDVRPFDMSLIPTKDIARFAKAHPDQNITAEAYTSWLSSLASSVPPAGNVVQTTQTENRVGNMSFTSRDGPRAIRAVENMLRQPEFNAPTAAR